MNLKYLALGALALMMIPKTVQNATATPTPTPTAPTIPTTGGLNLPQQNVYYSWAYPSVGGTIPNTLIQPNWNGQIAIWQFGQRLFLGDGVVYMNNEIVSTDFEGMPTGPIEVRAW